MDIYGTTVEARRSRVFTRESGGSASVLGIEITQAIQNLAHDVRLIAGKRTVARVYLQPNGLRRNVRVRGELAVATVAGAPERYLVSQNIVSLRSQNHPALSAQRDDVNLSVNFELPASQPGGLQVRLNRLVPVAFGDDIPLSAGDRSVQVEFQNGVPLRVRVIGLRYTDSRINDPQANTFAPDAIHFDFLRSYLTRTYPVPFVEWSQIVVPAGRRIAPPFTDGTDDDPTWQRVAQRVITRLQQIRQADINGGRDQRTHFYGLIADDRGAIRGRASRVAAFADPSVVSFGPSGRRGFAWDTDGSYADWYGAHELGHSFGCRHPGFCSRQQRDPSSSFPYRGGLISDAAEDCVGFDVGDPALGLPMRALPRDTASDFMTYCENQWISRHTYDELFARLDIEDRRFGPDDAVEAEIGI